MCSLAFNHGMKEGQQTSENLPGCAVQVGSVAGIIENNVTKSHMIFKGLKPDCFFLIRGKPVLLTPRFFSFILIPTCRDQNPSSAIQSVLSHCALKHFSKPRSPVSSLRSASQHPSQLRESLWPCELPGRNTAATLPPAFRADAPQVIR